MLVLVRSEWDTLMTLARLDADHDAHSRRVVKGYTAGAVSGFPFEVDRTSERLFWKARRDLRRLLPTASTSVRR